VHEPVPNALEIIGLQQELVIKMLSKRVLRDSLGVAMVGAVFALNNGCGGKNQSKATATAPPPPAVIVAEITQRTVPVYSEFVGQTQANETVELRARVEGILEKIYFKEGTLVNKGALLFSIDKRPFDASLQSARAIQAKAESDLAQAQQRTDVLQAQAELTDARATLSKTEQDLARMVPLAKEKAVTEIELDAATAANKSAKAIADAKQANLTNIEATVKYTIQRATAEVSAAKARVTQAGLDLSYCNIYSPLTGIIGFKQVDEGNLVGRGQATLLATVSASDPLLVDFSIGEIDFLKLAPQGSQQGNQARRAGLKLDLIRSDDTVHAHAGSLKVVDRSVDPQTGTMKVQASFPNPGSYLRPGQFARVRFAATEHENAILVPARAIQDLQGAKTVLVVDKQNKAALRTISVGDKSDKYLVVLQGLSAGERVVVEGMQKVRPGSEVKPTVASETAEPAQKTEPAQKSEGH
jgi:membrane fusion protein (multidrug efflux system)